VSHALQQQFAEQFVLNQDRIYGYITTLLPNRHDAEDVFQQTSLVLWKKWEEFDFCSDFLHWACGIAHNEVRNFLKGRGRDRLVFNDEMMSDLADVRIKMQANSSTHRDALIECMKRLTFTWRELLSRCYSGKESMPAVAKQFHMTPNALYLRLRKIRRDLLACIHKTLDDGDGGVKEDVV
jgi:RNA polymerase sigma-70 factor, ECF subfamily